MSGPATNTRATEMRHRGPVLKERKKIVKNVGREKNPRNLHGGLESMSGYRVGGWKEHYGTGVRYQKIKRK